MSSIETVIKELEQCLIVKNVADALKIQSSIASLTINETNEIIRNEFEQEKNYLRLIVEDIIKILNGNHIQVIQELSLPELRFNSLSLLTTQCFREQSLSFPDTLQELVTETIMSQSSETLESLTCLHIAVVGVCYQELFLQMNYTGPELPQSQLQLISLPEQDKYHMSLLECDGTYTFPMIQLPFMLVISRTIFSTLAYPQARLWRHGIRLDTEGRIFLKDNESSVGEILNSILERSLKYRRWFHGRCAIVHLRSLQKQLYSHVPTLWKESYDSYESIISRFISVAEESPNELLALAWLEFGLAHHYAENGDKGKSCFKKAQKAAGLHVELTGALGKRTKFQQTDYAQLVLAATSSLISKNSNDIKTEPMRQIGVMKNKPKEEADSEANPNAWQHAEWEVGRRLVGEVEGGTGEEAAVREVMLDSIDGGPQENILFEGGPKFTEIITEANSTLHPLDQSIILALCLDVSNSNPADGLTAEEMFPYIQRVLQLANNWMIHSTALLERSWLEYEKRRTFDRALLQIQALLDQHTTKLTITQSTFKAIEESAPVQDRLRYIYSIVYPAQYELKRDLANRYLKSQVFMSALGLFRELEMWDEVVQCYQLLDKPQRAEMLVRERLRNGETPYMVTALADLTRDEALYERAWQISNGRFARAKRTLGRICYDRGGFLECIQHLDQALAVQPLIATSWYLRGIAAMQIEDWPKSITSFVRCIQQDMEVAEAYANMGAIYMRQREYSKAHDALKEGLKYKGPSWKIIENLLNTSLALGKYMEAVSYMDRLLDMRTQSNRPLHKDEIRHLVDIAYAEFKTKQNESLDNKNSNQGLAGVLEAFLKRVTTTLHVDSEIWDILADFYGRFGRWKEALNCRSKELRVAYQSSGWVKDINKVKAIVSVSEKLANFLLDHAADKTLVSKSELYSAKSLVQSVVNSIQEEYYNTQLLRGDAVSPVEYEYQKAKSLIIEIDALFSNQTSV